MIFLILSVGSDESVSSEAEGKVSNFSVQSDFGVINDEFDAGYTLSFTVQNIGDHGVIRISPKISCSEGEWRKSQSLTCRAGESRNLTYFFHEPTINADNVYGSVNVFP